MNRWSKVFRGWPSSTPCIEQDFLFLYLLLHWSLLYIQWHWCCLQNTWTATLGAATWFLSCWFWWWTKEKEPAEVLIQCIRSKKGGLDGTQNRALLATNQTGMFGKSGRNRETSVPVGYSVHWAANAKVTSFWTLNTAPGRSNKDFKSLR